MKRPLAGLRLWVTRPAGELGASVERFRDLGAEADGVPLIERIDVEVGEAELRAIPPGATVVVASAHAAARWLDCTRRLPELAGRPVAVVGERAERELAGLVPGVVQRAPTAAELLALLPGPGPFVLAGSASRRPELPAGLRTRGAAVRELDLYRLGTPPPAAAFARSSWERSRPGAVAFYSPSAAEAFAALDLPGGQGVAALAVGPTTAGRLREFGLDVVAEGEPPGEDGLVEATSRWWAARG